MVRTRKKNEQRPRSNGPELDPNRSGEVYRSLFENIDGSFQLLDPMYDARQLIALVIRPPIKGPAADTIPAAALTIPNALARDSIPEKGTVARMQIGGISNDLS